MRIGLFLAYWPWFSPEEQIELARLADAQGIDSVTSAPAPTRCWRCPSGTDRRS